MSVDLVRGRGGRAMPWIGQSTELISGIHHRRIGRARLLLDFYTSRQTDARGRVYYGKAITYRWIASGIIECPHQRTLERYNSLLRRNGYIETHTVVQGGEVVGFTVRLRSQAKFNTRPAAIEGHQLGLLDQPARFPSATVSVEKPVEKLWKSCGNPVENSGGVPTELSVGTDRVVGVKDLKNKQAIRNNQHPAASAAVSPPRVFVTRGKQQMQRRLLAEIAAIREAWAGAGDLASLERRDLRLSALYQQLATAGWQDERAG